MFDIYNNKRVKNFIRLIAVALTMSFVAQDIAWAYPDKLAPESFFRKPDSQARVAEQYVDAVVRQTGISQEKLTPEATAAIARMREKLGGNAGFMMRQSASGSEEREVKTPQVNTIVGVAHTLFPIRKARELAKDNEFIVFERVRSPKRGSFTYIDLRITYAILNPIFWVIRKFMGGIVYDQKDAEEEFLISGRKITNLDIYMEKTPLICPALAIPLVCSFLGILLIAMPWLSRLFSIDENITNKILLIADWIAVNFFIYTLLPRNNLRFKIIIDFRNLVYATKLAHLEEALGRPVSNAAIFVGAAHVAGINKYLKNSDLRKKQWEWYSRPGVIGDLEMFVDLEKSFQIVERSYGDGEITEKVIGSIKDIPYVRPILEEEWAEQEGNENLDETNSDETSGQTRNSASGMTAKRKDRSWWEDPNMVNLAVTVPIFSLRRDHDDPGIGKFTDLARYYVDVLRKKSVNILSIMPPFAIFEESPYSSISLNALNDLYIDWSIAPEVAKDRELLRLLVATDLHEQQAVNYDSVRNRERKVSLVVYERFREEIERNSDRAKRFLKFVEQNKDWLNDYAEFMALHEIIGKSLSDWQGDEIVRAKKDIRYGELVELHKFMQWIAHVQFGNAVSVIHEHGGKIVIDIPMFRSKNGVDVWKYPEYFMDLDTRCPGVNKEGIYEVWMDLALWNWNRLKAEDYEFILRPIRRWLDFGIDGARNDALHFAYKYADWQLASGNEPGDHYVDALYRIFDERGALPLAEVYDGLEQRIADRGFMIVMGESQRWNTRSDWQCLSHHDTPRLYSSKEQFINTVNRFINDEPTYSGKRAKFISWTLGDEWGEVFPIKKVDPSVNKSYWRYRAPLKTDPDYNNRARFNADDYLSGLAATRQVRHSFPRSLKTEGGPRDSASGATELFKTAVGVSPVSPWPNSPFSITVTIVTVYLCIVALIGLRAAEAIGIATNDKLDAQERIENIVYFKKARKVLGWIFPPIHPIMRYIAISLIKKDRDMEVRVAAIGSLGVKDDKKSVRALQAIINTYKDDPSQEQVVDAAKEALAIAATPRGLFADRTEAVLIYIMIIVAVTSAASVIIDQLLKYFTGLNLLEHMLPQTPIHDLKYGITAVIIAAAVFAFPAWFFIKLKPIRTSIRYEDKLVSFAGLVLEKKFTKPEEALGALISNAVVNSSKEESGEMIRETVELLKEVSLNVNDRRLVARAISGLKKIANTYTRAAETSAMALKEIFYNCGKDGELRQIVIDALRDSARNKNQWAIQAIRELAPDLRRIAAEFDRTPLGDLTGWALSAAGIEPEENASEEGQGPQDKIRVQKRDSASGTAYLPLTEPMEFGACVAAINRLYYGMYGTEALEHFRTADSADTLTAETTAHEFYDHLDNLAKDGRLPASIVVYEWGIGNGNSAAAFLDTISALDRRHNTAYYTRIDYRIVDFSQKMLDDARSSKGLEQHASRTSFTQQDLSKDLPFAQDEALLIRFNELYDDFGKVALVFRQGEDFYETLAGLAIDNIGYRRKNDRAQITPQQFIAEYWPKRGIDVLSEDELQQILKKLNELYWSPADIKMRVIDEQNRPYAIRKIDLEAHPYGDFLRSCAGYKEKSFFVLNYGALENLKEAIRLLDKKRGGYIQFFDYGFTAKRDYAAPWRQSKGNLTCDVNFDFLSKALQGTKGLSVGIATQASYLSSHNATTGIVGTRGVFGKLLKEPKAKERFSDLWRSKFGPADVGFMRAETAIEQLVSWNKYWVTTGDIKEAFELYTEKEVGPDFISEFVRIFEEEVVRSINLYQMKVQWATPDAYGRASASGAEEWTGPASAQEPSWGRIVQPGLFQSQTEIVIDAARLVKAKEALREAVSRSNKAGDIFSGRTPYSTKHKVGTPIRPGDGKRGRAMARATSGVIDRLNQLKLVLSESNSANARLDSNQMLSMAEILPNLYAYLRTEKIFSDLNYRALKEEALKEIEILSGKLNISLEAKRLEPQSAHPTTKGFSPKVEAYLERIKACNFRILNEPVMRERLGAIMTILSEKMNREDAINSAVEIIERSQTQWTYEDVRNLILVLTSPYVQDATIRLLQGFFHQHKRLNFSGILSRLTYPVTVYEFDDVALRHIHGGEYELITLKELENRGYGILSAPFVPAGGQAEFDGIVTKDGKIYVVETTASSLNYGKNKIKVIKSALHKFNVVKRVYGGNLIGQHLDGVVLVFRKQYKRDIDSLTRFIVEVAESEAGTNKIPVEIEFASCPQFHYLGFGTRDMALKPVEFNGLQDRITQIETSPAAAYEYASRASASGDGVSRNGPSPEMPGQSKNHGILRRLYFSREQKEVMREEAARFAKLAGLTKEEEKRLVARVKHFNRQYPFEVLLTLVGLCASCILFVFGNASLSPPRGYEYFAIINFMGTMMFRIMHWLPAALLLYIIPMNWKMLNRAMAIQTGRSIFLRSSYSDLLEFRICLVHEIIHYLERTRKIKTDLWANGFSVLALIKKGIDPLSIREDKASILHLSRNRILRAYSIADTIKAEPSRIRDLNDMIRDHFNTEIMQINRDVQDARAMREWKPVGFGRRLIFTFLRVLYSTFEEDDSLYTVYEILHRYLYPTARIITRESFWRQHDRSSHRFEEEAYWTYGYTSMAAIIAYQLWGDKGAEEFLWQRSLGHGTVAAAKYVSETRRSASGDNVLQNETYSDVTYRRIRPWEVDGRFLDELEAVQANSLDETLRLSRNALENMLMNKKGVNIIVQKNGSIIGYMLTLPAEHLHFVPPGVDNGTLDIDMITFLPEYRNKPVLLRRLLRNLKKELIFTPYTNVTCEAPLHMGASQLMQRLGGTVIAKFNDWRGTGLPFDILQLDLDGIIDKNGIGTDNHERMPIAERVKNLVKEKGRVTFDTFMDWALYLLSTETQEGGYYTDIARYLSWTTRPRQYSPLYGAAAANHIFYTWNQMQRPEEFSVVEIAGGEGRFSRDILDAIKKEHPDLYARLDYVSVEISPTAIERQKALIGTDHNVRWVTGSALDLSSLHVQNGYFVMNELVANLSAHLVVGRNGAIKELYVTLNDEGELKFIEDTPGPGILEYFTKTGMQFPEEGERMPIVLNYEKLLEQLSRSADRAVFLMLYYTRTLSPVVTYGRLVHQNADPFQEVGELDMTVGVSFEEIIKLARPNGLDSEFLLEESSFFSTLDPSLVKTMTPSNIHALLLSKGLEGISLWSGNPSRRSASGMSSLKSNAIRGIIDELSVDELAALDMVIRENLNKSILVRVDLLPKKLKIIVKERDLLLAEILNDIASHFLVPDKEDKKGWEDLFILISRAITEREYEISQSNKNKEEDTSRRSASGESEEKLEPSSKIELVQAKKRLTALMERGSGWLRIAATPHEAYAFHKGWVSDISGEYAARLGDETYIFPIRIWEKMVAWSKKSKDLERSGIFSIRQTSPHIYEAMDFIPLGSLAYDPSIRNEEVSDVYATQGTDFLFDKLLEASTIEALGIDLELQWRLISEESGGDIIISAHSHHRNAYYRDSPSKPDQKEVGKEGIAFVYCNAVKKGFIYNEDTIVEVEQKPYLRASGSSRDSASGKRNRQRTKWTDGSVIDLLNNPPAGVEKPSSSYSWYKPGYGGMVDAAIKIFGSWDNALKGAGLGSGLKRNKWTDESILEQLRYPPPGVNPSSSTSWQKAGYASVVGVVIRKFGGWHKALIKAGLAPIQKSKPAWQRRYTDWNVVYEIMPDVVNRNGEFSSHRIRHLTYQEISALSEEVQRGNSAARDTLILSYERLVKYVAQFVYNNYKKSTPGLEKEDLVSVGRYGLRDDSIGGLARAVELYDPGKGASLYGYAWRRVYQAMVRYAERLRKKAATSLDEEAVGGRTIEDHIANDGEADTEVLLPREAFLELIRRMNGATRSKGEATDWSGIASSLLELFPADSRLYEEIDGILRHNSSPKIIEDRLYRLAEHLPDEGAVPESSRISGMRRSASGAEEEKIRPSLISANEVPSTKITLLDGIVREEFITPGLIIIEDSDIFIEIMRIASQYNPDANFAGGVYISKAEINKPNSIKKKELYLRVIKYLEERSKQPFDRVAIVPSGSNPTDIRHEILHDYVEMISQTHKEMFDDLVKNISALVKKIPKFDSAYFYITMGSSIVDNPEEALKEFVSKFFSLGFAAPIEEKDNYEVREAKKAYKYILKHMPNEIKKMFYEVGIIWPKSSPLEIETKDSPENIFPQSDSSESSSGILMEEGNLPSPVEQRFYDAIADSDQNIQALITAADLNSMNEHISGLLREKGYAIPDRIERLGPTYLHLTHNLESESFETALLYFKALMFIAEKSPKTFALVCMGLNQGIAEAAVTGSCYTGNTMYIAKNEFSFKNGTYVARPKAGEDWYPYDEALQRTANEIVHEAMHGLLELYSFDLPAGLQSEGAIGEAVCGKYTLEFTRATNTYHHLIAEEQQAYENESSNIEHWGEHQDMKDRVRRYSASGDVQSTTATESTSPVSQFLYTAHELMMEGITAHPIEAEERIVLSENLFIGEDGDRKELDDARIALASALKSGRLQIVDLEELKRIATNANTNRTSKNKVAAVMTEADYNSKIWNGSKDMSIKSSILIVSNETRLTSSNYLYLQGVIGLARAIMANDKPATKRYYQMLSGTTIDDEILKLLDDGRENNIAFAIKAILRLKPMLPIDSGEKLRGYRLEMENYLIAA